MKIYFDLSKPQYKAVIPSYHDSPSVPVYQIILKKEYSPKGHSFVKIKDNTEIPIPLSKEMLKNLVYYFMSDLGNKRFSCHEFVSLCLFGTYEKDLDLKWSFPENYQIGNAVGLVNTEGKTPHIRSIKHFEHSAIYLGDDLFLSKIGDKNEVVVATLETLQQFYWMVKETAKMEVKLK